MEGNVPGRESGVPGEEVDIRRFEEFSMKPERQKAVATIEETFELYKELSQVNQAIDALESFDKIEQQLLDELKERRGAIIDRLIELEEVNKKDVERSFRIGKLAMFGVATEAREQGAVLIVNKVLFDGDKSSSNESSGYLGVIKREFGRRLLDDEESSE